MADRIITTLVAHDRDVPRDWVLGHVTPDAGVRVTEVIEDLNDARSRLESARGDVFLIACGPESDDALALIAWWTRHRPDAPVVVLSYASPNGFSRFGMYLHMTMPSRYSRHSGTAIRIMLIGSAGVSTIETTQMMSMAIRHCWM